MMTTLQQRNTFEQYETESLSLRPDRQTSWQSDTNYSDDQRDSVQTTASTGVPGGRAMLRDPAMSAMTIESTGGDPFAYSMYESLPSPSDSRFRPDSNIPIPSSSTSTYVPPSRSSSNRSNRSARQRTAAPPPPPLSTTSFNTNPIVRIGPPSPELLPDPHDSGLWKDRASESPSTSILANFPRIPDTSTSSQRDSGRVRSQTATKNFSRPFLSGHDPAIRDAYGGVTRSESFDSFEEGGQQSSSVGHSSQGAHSTSSSWEGRLELEERYKHQQKLYAHQQQLQQGQSQRQQEETGVARGENWRPVDRGLDSPMAFAAYREPTPPSASAHSPSKKNETRMTLSAPSPGDGRPGSQSSYAASDDGTTGYRLDSYYAPPRSPTASSSGDQSPGIVPPSPYREETAVEIEDQRPRTAESPRQKGVLRKPRPLPTPNQPPQPSPDRTSGGSSKWNPFTRSRSKSRKSSREAVDEGVPITPPWANEPPAITFSHDLPPAELNMSPGGMLRQQQQQQREDDDEAERERELERERARGVRPLQREQPSYQPGAGRSVMGSYVHNGSSPPPPGWGMSSSSTSLPGGGVIPAEDAVEQLDDRPSYGRPSPKLSESDSTARGPKRLAGPQAPAMQRPPSSNSLYSNYSFYSLPENGTDFSSRSGPNSRQPSLNASPNLNSGNSPRFAPPPPSSTGGSGGGPGVPASSTLAKAKAGIKNSNNDLPVGDPVTPDDFLQLGIKYHEGGELERSAWYFEQSAKKDGGCGAGMLMYGLTLRHGWGCQVNMELGFRYLQSAAETVVHDLDRVVAGGRELSKEESDTKAVKNELVLALHEIGTSFRFGWGVAKDKKMAVSYFQLAADLGDPDAQSELAFCLANGKGCKKDMKKAAKYYRMAVAQGGETFGLSWIYKPKYMDD